MLYKNDVIEHKESKIRSRVVHTDYAEGEVWLFNLADKKALPGRSYIAEVDPAVVPNIYGLVDGVTSSQAITPSKAAIAHRDAAHSRIKPLVDNPEIFIPDTRCALVKARAKEMGCSTQTVYQDLRNWWRNGQAPNALLPRFHKKGSTDGTTANRGRPRKYQGCPIFQITEADRTLIGKGLERHFLVNDFITLHACYQRILEEHYSYVDGEGKLSLNAEGKYPSEQQFRRLVNALLPKETAIRRRKGDAEFELNHRAKLGSLIHETYTVGDAYEIDATIADTLLVSSRDRARIIDKPSLYLVFDRKSWLIVGFYVGLEPASWPAAMQAIKSISEDKVVLCKRYGVPYDPADWPAHQVFPKEFIADRGEMFKANSMLLVDGMDTIVKNLPARRAEQKPLVECGFKLIQRAMADSTPGYVPPENFGKRQTKHYDEDACLNLHEFTAVILKAIITFNRTPRPGYNWPAENVLNGIQPIPINIWNLEVIKRAGALSRIPEEVVRFALLPKAEATVTREGIGLGACSYSCPEAMSRGWMVAAGRGAFNVQVSYDRRLVDTIYIHDDKDPTRHFVATLLDKCSDFRGLSFAEVEGIEHKRETLRQEGHHIGRQNQMDFHQHIDPMTRKASAEMKKLTKGQSRTSRKKDIVENRQDELRRQRQVEARIPGATPTDKPTAEIIPLIPTRPDTSQTNPAANAVVSDQDARRRQKYTEMLNGN
jgi:hypothetical protein